MVKKTNGNGNGWERHQELVLAELQRNSAELKSMSESLSSLKTDVAVLKKEFQIKAGIWGGLSGLVAAVGTALVLILGIK